MCIRRRACASACTHHEFARTNARYKGNRARSVVLNFCEDAFRLSASANSLMRPMRKKTNVRDNTMYRTICRFSSNISCTEFSSYSIYEFRIINISTGISCHLFIQKKFNFFYHNKILTLSFSIIFFVISIRKIYHFHKF